MTRGPIAAAALVLMARVIAAQPSPVSEKSPDKAAVFGTLIPGAGHIYAGEPGRGATFFALATLNVVGGFFVYNADVCVDSSIWTCEGPDPETVVHVLGAVQIGLGAAVWIVSAIDAPRAVRRQEERRHALAREAGPMFAQWRPLAASDRSPSTAAMLGVLFPGAGHVYAGEPGRGAAFFGITALNVASGLAMDHLRECKVYGFLSCEEHGDDRPRYAHTVAVISYSIAAIAWLGSAIDAPRAVRRQQERQRSRLGDARLPSTGWRPMVGYAPRGGVQLGLRSAW
jgi:TM2 domain-containing membrane protein YozV